MAVALRAHDGDRWGEKRESKFVCLRLSLSERDISGHAHMTSALGGGNPQIADRRTKSADFWIRKGGGFCQKHPNGLWTS